MATINLVQLVVSALIIVLSVVVLVVDIKVVDENRYWHSYNERAGGFADGYGYVQAGIPIPWHDLSDDTKDDVFPVLRYPNNFSFARPGAFIGFYIIIVAANVLHTLLLTKERKGLIQAPRICIYGLLASAVAFALAFVAVVYGWQGAGEVLSVGEVYASSTLNTTQHGYVFRIPTGHLASLDPFTWNCALYPMLKSGLRHYSTQFGLAEKALGSMCTQTHAIIGLAIPILVLCAAMLGIQMWIVFRSRGSKSLRAQPNFIKMPDEPPGQNDVVPLVATPGGVRTRGGPGYPEGRSPEVLRP